MRKKVIALNSTGKLVLKARNGSEEEIAPPEASQRVAILVLDCSASMDDGKRNQARTGSSQFAAEAMACGYSVAIVTFDSYARLALEMTRDPERLHSALHMTTTGSTNMAAGIWLALEHLHEISDQRVIVLVTDGAPDSREAAITAANKAKQLGVCIMTIGTSDADEAFLAHLASEPRAAAKVPPTHLAAGIARAARLLPRRPIQPRPR